MTYEDRLYDAATGHGSWGDAQEAERIAAEADNVAVLGHQDGKETSQIASSTISGFDKQDLRVILNLVQDEIEEAMRWSQRAVALVDLEKRITEALTGQTSLDVDDA